MALPFLIPLLLGGAAIGGVTAKKRNQSFLEGALQGALVGGLGSVGAGAAGLGAAGAGAGAGAAGAGITKAAATAPLKGAVATAAPSIAAPVSTPLSLGQIGKTGTALAEGLSPTAYAKTLGLSAPTASTASTASSAPMAAINKQIAELGIKEAAPSTFDKILATAKDKPMETMQFASALGGGEQQAPAPSMAPVTQPGGFGNVPTIEESIGMDSGPRFISKGLFDESKRSMEEEEMALMYQKLSEAGLV